MSATAIVTPLNTERFEDASLYSVNYVGSRDQDSGVPWSYIESAVRKGSISPKVIVRDANGSHERTLSLPDGKVHLTVLVINETTARVFAWENHAAADEYTKSTGMCEHLPESHRVAQRAMPALEKQFDGGRQYRAETLVSLLPGEVQQQEHYPLAFVASVSNHPNRRREAPGRNPKPAEIAQTREEAGLTQTEAATLLYVSLSGWQRWEQGERRMHPALWEYFCLLVSFADVERARRTWLELPGGKFDRAQVNQSEK